MPVSVIDRIVTILGYEYDKRGLTQFQQGLRQTRASMNAVGNAGKVWGRRLTTGFLAGVTAFADVESSLAKIEGLVGIDREVLDGWGADIERIATETGQLPGQLADALFFVTSAGLRGSDAMSVLEQSARAATAGLGDTVTIADLLTSAMNAYGPENLTAAMAVDSLTEAVRLGKLESTALAGAMGRLMPMSSELGVEFNEVAGLMAAMSKTGTTAEEAVTQLNQVMLTLLKPADGAVKALDKMGISFAELRAQAGAEGLWPVLVRLKEAFDGDNQALVEIFPNVRALRGVFDLLGPQMASNEELIREMADSTGVLGEAFDAASRTIKFDARQALADLLNTVIELGALMAPAARRFLGWARDLFAWFRGLSDGWKRFAAGLLAAGPFLFAAGLGLKVIAGMLGFMAGTLRFVALGWKVTKAAMLGAKTAMLAVTGATAVTTGALTALKAAMLAISPLAIAAAVIGAAYLIWRYRDEIVGVLKSVWSWISDFAKRFGKYVLIALGGPFVWAGALIWKFRDQIIDGIKAVVGWIGGAAKWFWDAGVNLMKTLGKGILKGLLWPLNAVKQVLGKVRNLLPFSDAKEGPLRDITRSGRSLPGALAEGVRGGGMDLRRALSDTLGGMMAPLSVGPLPPSAFGSGPSVSIRLDSVTINVPSGDPQQIADGLVDGVVAAAEAKISRRIVEHFDTRERA